MYMRYRGGGVGHLGQFRPANNDNGIVYEDETENEENLAVEDVGDDGGDQDNEEGKNDEDNGDKDEEREGHEDLDPGESADEDAGNVY